MLGDSTVINQKTFDPMLVREFYKKIIQKLSDWDTEDVLLSNNEDIRRIFTKFKVQEGNYLLSGHFSLQYHVLLYYKPDKKVIEYQKELSQIIEMIQSKEAKLADESNYFILEKLKNMGYRDLNQQDLFEFFFANDELRKKIYMEMEGKTGINFKSLTERKIKLFNELDNLLIETYTTTPILIDDARLVTGEEGCLCTFDLEFIKNNVKEGIFDPKKIPDKIKDSIKNRFDEIINVMSL
jgi:hypothetical protein